MKEHQAGQIVFGRYDLLRPLARGGMSSLWVASDRKLKREVALKLMAASYADQERSRQRFELEAMAVARLQSPHIVQIYDYGVDNRSPFIVMELLQGEDLRRRLKKVRTLPLATVAKLVVDVALGLSEAHEAGLVHRDLKPGNIFLATTRSGEVPKILDFGVAKESAETATPLTRDELTERGAIVGTPQYMSPEQVRCLPAIDLRADLFSLGVIIYKALAGRLPFRGATAEDLRVNICVATFPPLTSLVAGLPPAIDALLERALAKDPANRFQTAQELADALRAVSAQAGPQSSLPQVSPDDSALLSQSWPSGPPTTGSGLGSTSPSGPMGSRSDASSAAQIEGPSSTHTSPTNGVATSLEATLLEEATRAQQLSQRWRQIAIIAIVASVLAVAGIAGTMVGQERDAPEPVLAQPGDGVAPGEPAGAAPVESIDLDEPSPVPEPTASAVTPPPPKKVAPRPKPASRPPPAAPPPPPPSDDWDPFKKRN